VTHARLFFALWPDEAERAATAALMTEVVPGGGRWMTRDNLHATLLFMGEVSTTLLAAVTQAAARISAAAFTVKFDRLEYWPRARMLVLTSSEVPAAFTQLAAQLQDAMQTFMPALIPKGQPAPQQLHVSLARQVTAPATGTLHDVVIWRAQRFALVASTLGAEGSRYRVIEQWPLSVAS